jgi:hypothetical protein
VAAVAAQQQKEAGVVSVLADRGEDVGHGGGPWLLRGTVWVAGNARAMPGPSLSESRGYPLDVPSARSHDRSAAERDCLSGLANVVDRLGPLTDGRGPRPRRGVRSVTLVQKVCCSA